MKFIEPTITKATQVADPVIEKTSVKIFSSADTETLEDSINYFLKDSSIELVSINYVLTSNGWEKVLIVYKHWD